jgi:hypothetical protein
MAPGAPLSAQDFWTEESAAIHHALEAPAGRGGAEGEGRRRFARHGRFAGARRPLRFLEARIRVVGRARPSFSWRHARAAAVAAVVLVVAGLIVERLDPGGAGPELRPLTPTLLTERFSPPAVRLPGIRAAEAERPRARSSHEAPGHRSVAAPRPSTPGTETAASTAVSSTASAAASAPGPGAATNRYAAGGSPSSATGYSRSQPTVVTHSSAPTTQSNAASTGARPTSSQSQPAFGAAGALGPGSSPDS